MPSGRSSAPLIPPAKRGGNKRTVNIREVVNGVMYAGARERRRPDPGAIW